MHTLFRQLARSCRSFAAVHHVPFPRIRRVTCSLDARSVNFHNIISRRMGSSDTTKQPDFVKDVVALEELDTDLYISHSAWKAGTARAMFGGQIIVQALASGNMTMVPGLNLHSMHCYFLRPGDVNRSTVYRVNRTRDGSSFSSRSISAMQKGRPILTLQASYHNELAETSKLQEYQPQKPEVKHHSELKTTKEFLEDYLKKPDISDTRKALLSKSLEVYNSLPVEIKPLDAAVYMRQKPNPENKITAWIRVTGDLGDDQNMHRAAAAYISDWTLLWSAISSYSSFRPGMMASLDHSVWFHKPFNMNEWLLYECSGSNLTNSKGLTYGKMWKESGELALSCAQEGVIRSKM